MSQQPGPAEHRDGAGAAVLVLGPHRAGTSCVTEIVHRLGYAVGRDLLGAHECNVNGLWENAALVGFNQALFLEQGSDWFDPRCPRLDAPPPGRPQLRAELAALLSDQFGAAPHVVLKDPRCCRLAGLYAGAFRALGHGPRALVVLRHPLASARSLYRRDGLPLVMGLALWTGHMLGALHASRDMDRYLLSYDSLLRDPDHWLGDLALWLGQGAAAAPEALDAARAALDPALCHEQGAAPEDLMPAFRPLCQLALELFHALEAAAPSLAAVDERLPLWQARFDALLPAPGWCASGLRLVLHGPGPVPDPALPGVLERLDRHGASLLMVCDGVEDGGLDPLLADAMASGRVGLFHNLCQRGEAASQVRGISLRAGRDLLLVHRQGLEHLPQWLSCLSQAQTRPDRALALGRLHVQGRDLPAALFLPDALAAGLDAWAFVPAGDRALDGLLKHLGEGLEWTHG